MVKHYLKTVNPHFDEARRGNKRFEMRKDDRPVPYSKGDILVLQEFDGTKYPEYRGGVVVVRVTHIMRNWQFSEVPEGWCLMSIRKLWFWERWFV